MRNFAVAAVLFAAACSHQQRASTSSENLSAENASAQQATAQPIAEQPVAQPSTSQPMASQPMASQPTAAAEPVRHFRCVPCASTQRQNVAGHESCPIVRVHFAFDDDQLTDAAKATLARNSECFRRGATQLSVEGNADER
ncbi:MAG TPA: hypothetical protein VFF06_05295, partial [Polyangia bacterium]|nr:hypothetical protein [Polyangia bacterium]